MVAGYCYATPYRPRPAYRYTLEESIYVEAGMGGRGIGSALLSRLIAEAVLVGGEWQVKKAIMSRSARVLMEGRVHVPRAG